MGFGAYPLSMAMQRQFDATSAELVHVWDVDKTYLDTHFSSLEGMATIPIEFAVDKRAYPGMPELLRGLRWGGGERYACVPIVFVTASPPQLRAVLERKMMLDGIEWDGIIFKNWLGVLRSLRWARLKEQLGFKLCALLSARLLRPSCQEYLYGDDTEKDAEAFDLYSRIVNEELSAADTELLMRHAGVDRQDRRSVHVLTERLGAKRGTVQAAFVHLAKHSPRSRFEPMQGRVVPVRHAAELALALWDCAQLRAEAVHRVLDAALGQFSADARARCIDEAVQRGLVGEQRLAALHLPSRAG